MIVPRSIAFSMLTLVLLVGRVGSCVADESEYVALFKEMIEKQDQLNAKADALVKLLAQVQDPGSARQVAAKLGPTSDAMLQAWSAATPSLKKAMELGKNPPQLSPATMQKLEAAAQRQPAVTKEWLRLSDQLGKQVARIGSMRGLPVEFWNEFRLFGAKYTLIFSESLAAAGLGGSAEANKYFGDKIVLMERYDADKVVDILLDGSSPDTLARTKEGITRSLGSDVTILLLRGNAGVGDILTIAPVNDFHKALTTFDAKKIVDQDEPQRMIRLRLGDVPAKPVVGPQAPMAQTKPRVERLPERSDPEYFRKLSDLIVDKQNWMLRDDAVDALLMTDPAAIKDKDVRKQIARNFRELATKHGSPDDVGKAVRGLALYGGKYSVPILVQMIEDEQLKVNPEVFHALASLQDPQGAEAVARQLGSFFNHDAAVACLRRMGPPAEDALIDVAPSENPQVSLAAVQLLGEVGTDKSLPLLRKAASSTNASVRDAAKTSLAKIRDRNSKATD